MSYSRIHFKKYPNYRTDVFVDGKFAYQTGHHPKSEAENLTKLIKALNLEDVIIVDSKEEE